jgi:hypothetical protein
MHFACLLGEKFGIVTANSPASIAEMETMVRLQGLQDRAIPHSVRGISMGSYDVFTKGL